tara:strand:+ start:1149 stop:1418 length:270 start_codon:yes stop_codon:yes gene_type:complete
MIKVNKKIFIHFVSGCFIAGVFSALFLIPVEQSRTDELIDLQIKATKLRIEELKKSRDTDDSLPAFFDKQKNIKAIELKKRQEEFNKNK